MFLVKIHLEANAEGVELSPPLLGSFSVCQVPGSDRSDQRRIQATREQDAKGHIGHKPLDHSLNKLNQKHTSISSPCNANNNN